MNFWTVFEIGQLPTDNSKFYTMEEVAEFVGLNKMTLWHYLKYKEVLNEDGLPNKNKDEEFWIKSTKIKKIPNNGNESARNEVFILCELRNKSNRLS